MTVDPWAELTPGALGRLTLASYGDVAAALADWYGGDPEQIQSAALWFAFLGMALQQEADDVRTDGPRR